MKLITYYIILFFTILSCKGKTQISVSGYTNYNLSGFDVLVEDKAFVMNDTLTKNAIKLLKNKLLEVSKLNIDKDKINALKAVPIFMDWNTNSGGAVYHPSETWLIDNGYISEKANCVELSNITNFYNWTKKNQPYMVLHELSHAYHHRVLNYNNATITNAFNNAVTKKLYKNISFHDGDEVYFDLPEAYALNDEFEYFAELSEAYFGLNDYYPFNYDNLRSYDPVGFNAMMLIWGDINLSIPSKE